MRLKRTTAIVVGVVASVALAAQPAWAAVLPGSGWYTHPSTAGWSCGTTTNGTYFSVQVCWTAPGTSHDQAALIVKNRSGSLRSASASVTPAHNGTVTCSSSGIGANDYSVCYTMDFSHVPGTGTYTGYAKDTATGEIITAVPKSVTFP